MKKICFGIAVMLFGLTLEQYLHEGWLYCLASVVGLGFAIWGLLSKEER